MEVQRINQNIFTLLDEELATAPPNYPEIIHISEGIRPTIYSKSQPKIKGSLEEPRSSPKEIHIRSNRRPSPPNNRKSRTGLSNEIKRQGAGLYNWGEYIPKTFKDKEKVDVQGDEALMPDTEISEEIETKVKSQENGVLTMSEYLGLEENEEAKERNIIDNIVDFTKKTVKKAQELVKKVEKELEKGEPPGFKENDFPELKSF
ncbi:unnamed protein product [Blepharisma stoltei]|uniref:Hyaluronan/mRNA-binding protein domain-containing protein n=1 Tax=Blepharisma stoltei TaxID=1481888 RepID=A0AAU9JYC4_9CILI|nr:unnamed protein product [Blepharisma stoltei]